MSVKAVNGPESISELLTICNNDKCAECGSLNVECISLLYNVFLCRPCNEVHASLYGLNVKAKGHLFELADPFTAADLLKLKQSGGNKANRDMYESKLPAYYRRPSPRCVDLLRREFILSKYRRIEFVDTKKHPNILPMSFSNGPEDVLTISSNPKDSYLYKKGVLLKRLRDVDKYVERIFELNMSENYLRYFLPDKKEPKASLDLDRLNVTILDSTSFQVPENCMLINWVVDGSTRNMFVSCDNGAILMAWYLAIRGAKFNRALLHITGMGEEVDQMALCEELTYDYVMFGWLEKLGPQADDAWRRRWCMLGRRRLVYCTHRHAPFSKGEVMIGSAEDGYEVKPGTTVALKKPTTGYMFTLVTPHRNYIFQEPDSREVRDRWMEHIQRVIRTPMTMDDKKEFANIVRKRRTGLLS